MNWRRSWGAGSLLSWSLLAPLSVAADLPKVPDAVAQAESARIAAVAKATRSAVAVFDVGDPGGGGSAVVISPDGYALTNFHVVSPVGAHMKCGMEDGQLYDAVLVGIDPTGDVALIQLLGRDDFPTAEIADSDTVAVGDWCFAVGNPFLLAHDFRPTVTYGIVSGVHRYQEPAGTLLEYADCLQTDAAINPGNSGGPLFNAAGQLIGINGRGSFEKRGRVNVGVGYAISINQIQNFLGHLKSGRIVDHATWGATVSTDEDGRVLVTNILPSSDAYRRGIRYGDQILSFGNRTITSANDFKNVLGIYPRGWRVPITYQRDGNVVQTWVRLAGVHAREELLELVTPRAAGGQGPRHPGGPPDEREVPRPDKPREGDSQPPAEPRDGSEPNEPPGSQQPAEGAPGGSAPGAGNEEKPADEPPLPAGSVKSPYGEVLPPEIAARFESRYGYVNYFYNRQQRDQLWQKWNQTSQLNGRDSAWTLTGVDQNQARWTASVNADRVEAQFGSVRFQGDAKSEEDIELFPTGSGGWVWALHQWRRAQVLGPEQFGEVYYLGIEPLARSDRKIHVLVATSGIFETQFGFDTETEQLVSILFSADEETDPCEIRLSDLQPYGEHQVPSRWEVWWGDKLFGTLRLETFSSGVASPSAPGSSPSVSPPGNATPETATPGSAAPDSAAPPTTAPAEEIKS